jgi:hypothetical protein
MKTRKLGIAPTLVVTVLVLGFALLIGVILLMMYIRPGIEHSPEQASITSSVQFFANQTAFAPFAEDVTLT